MPKKYSGPAYEKERKRQNRLQRDVLEHLKNHGPKNYDLLYVFFDPNHTAAIQPALTDLTTYGLISMDKDKMVQITDAGLERLKDQTYW
jgi:hypothetical protein